MFKEKCFCCNAELTDKKQCFEVSSSTYGRYICRECASEIGIKNFISAGIHSKTSLLKKYIKLHPEAQVNLDQHREAQAKQKAEFKAELQVALAKANKKVELSKCKEKTQEKYTCLSCQNIWYITDVDHVKNLFNASTGNVFTVNQLKDVSKCPKCGSKATKKEKKKYWVDKKGSCVDAEQ